MTYSRNHYGTGTNPADVPDHKKPQSIGEYMGYALTLRCISYCCESLSLYGYATERSLKSAVRKKLRKTGKI